MNPEQMNLDFSPEKSGEEKKAEEVRQEKKKEPAKEKKEVDPELARIRERFKKSGKPAIEYDDPFLR